MAKQKKTKETDQEILKHYTGGEDFPAEINQHTKKILKKALAAKPAFIKPDITVDHTMGKRKSAVINLPPAGSENKKK